MEEPTTAQRNEDRRPLRADFVQMLDWLLKSKGVSQRRFVADVGLSSHTEVSRWRTLAYEPRPETVFAIEEYFGLNPGALSRTLGYLPVTARFLPRNSGDFEAAVRSDDVLPDWGKEILLATFRGIMKSLEQRRSSFRS